jgi:hypothetical protein
LAWLLAGIPQIRYVDESAPETVDVNLRNGVLNEICVTHLADQHIGH